jgi:hypothetical protein
LAFKKSFKISKQLYRDAEKHRLEAMYFQGDFWRYFAASYGDLSGCSLKVFPAYSKFF